MITQTDAPKFYACRLVKDGPRVGVRVWYGVPADPDTGEPLDRAARWQVTVSGEFIDPLQMLMLVGNVAYIKGDEINEAEHKYLCDVATWATAHAPDAPESSPRTAIDLNAAKPIF